MIIKKRYLETCVRFTDKMFIAYWVNYRQHINYTTVT